MLITSCSMSPVELELGRLSEAKSHVEEARSESFSRPARMWKPPRARLILRRRGVLAAIQEQAKRIRGR